MAKRKSRPALGQRDPTAAEIRAFVRDALMETPANAPLILRATAEILPDLPGGVDDTMRKGLFEAAALADQAAEGFPAPEEPSRVADHVLSLQGRNPELIWLLGEAMLTELRDLGERYYRRGLADTALKFAPVIRRLEEPVLT